MSREMVACPHLKAEIDTKFCKNLCKAYSSGCIYDPAKTYAEDSYFVLEMCDHQPNN